MVLWANGRGTRLYKGGEEVVLMEDRLRWSASQLRELWKEAGVHIYLETGDVFYVGRNWLCVHTLLGGERVVKFPFHTQVTDPLNDHVVSDSTNSVKMNLAPRSTTLLRITPL